MTTMTTVLLSAYAVGLVSGLVAWMVRKGVNNS